MTALTGHADELVGSVKPLVTNLDQTVTNVNTTVDAVREPLTNDLAELKRTLESASALLEGLQRVVGDNEGDIQETVRSLRTASDNVRALSQTLKERPMESHSHVATWRQKGTAMTNRRERTLRAVVALLGTLAMGGCGSVHYPAHYTLNFEPSVQAPAPARSTGTVAVRELRCPDYLCEGRIVYRPTPAEVGFYEFHRWAVSPRAMIAQHLADTRSGAFALHQRRAERVPLAERLRAERHDRAARGGRRRSPVAAVCTISAQLVRHSQRIRRVESHRHGTRRSRTARRGRCGERADDSGADQC
jgi:ABC-type uncharacterized transport system auxiliary subunit